MAYTPKINVGGTDYNVKDSEARNSISTICEEINLSYSESIGHYAFPMEYLEAPTVYVSGAVDVSGNVYFNNNKIRIRNINKIRFLAKTGTTEFYIVTYDEANNSCSVSLLASVTSTSSENNTIKEVSVSVFLADNQFIGISGIIPYVNLSGYNNTQYRISDGTIIKNENQLILYDTENKESEINGIDTLYDLRMNVTGGKDYINLEALNAYGTITTNEIFVQDIPYPIPKFNRIQFRAVEGTMKVYKVEYIKENTVLKYSVIAQYTITAAEAGSLKTMRLNGELKKGQYIGVSGSFAWLNFVPGCYEWKFTEANQTIYDRQHQTPLFKVFLDSTISDDYEYIANANSDVLGGIDLIDIEGIAYTEVEVSNVTVNDGFKYPLGMVDRIQYRAVTGQISFYKVEVMDEQKKFVLNYKLIGTYTNTAAENGLIKTIRINETLGRNQYIGASGNIAYTNDAAGYKTWSFNTTGDHAISDPSNGQLIMYKVFQSGSLAETKEDKNKKFRHGEVTLYSKALTSNNSDLIGTLTDSAYGLSISSRVMLNKFYASANREVKYFCKFSSDCVAYFETLVFTDYSVQSIIVVDVANKQFGVSTYPLESCPILNSSDEFMISIYLDYDNLEITVTNLNNGKSVSMSTYNSFIGGGGSGAVEIENNHTLPRFTDYYAIEKHSGTLFLVKKMIVTCAKCDILICGDSITEAYPYWPYFMYPKHWAQRIISKADGRAMVSARGGCNIIQLREWLGNELPMIKPKYCMITIGANGSNTQQNLTELVQFIEAQGAIPILNHIPCYDKNGVTDFAPINATIDTVRQSADVSGADFNIPTSTGRNGTAVNTSTMWKDEYPNGDIIYIHPNEFGSLLMFNQVLEDVPEIFT